MKYLGIELPWNLTQKLNRFSKRGIGKLYVLLEPLPLYNGKRRLATPKEEKEYAELLERRNKYVAEVKERKDRQKRNAEAMALHKARALIARHEKKADNAVKS